MDSIDKKTIRAARPTNAARVVSAFIFILLYSFYEYKIVLYFAFLQFTLSIVWFWIIEKNLELYKNFPSLWYLPASIDVFFATASVYITGVSYSPVIIAYILITCMSSVDLIRMRGIFTTITSCLSFTAILLLTKYKFIPFINILGDSNTEISSFSMILSEILLTLGCFTANSVIYEIYFQLNEKNNNLSTSLDKINVLKLQQDADYALTARLIEPFSGVFTKSKNVQIEFYLRQKKSFHFKNHLLEIGGDILFADELYFNNSKYIFFANGDAMGKSIQGACGALVLGVISKSIIIATQSQKINFGHTPQAWLSNTMTEIQRIFESFEGTMLSSIFVGLIEEKTGTMHYLNIEHPNAILYRDETANFLGQSILYPKLGSQGFKQTFDSGVESFKLIDGDILFIGSDGKDDIILKNLPSKTINEDENLFLKILQKEKANLKKIISELDSKGELSDDLSILKIHYSNLNSK